ncbi:ornithine cyclodeaminase family protein, partial [Enterococcus faecalis]
MDIISYERVIQQLSFSEAIQVMKRCFAELHLCQILLFDSSTGIPVAMMDANAITWLRTAAVSALATDYLAAPNAKSIALIGAGQQASSHLAALQSVRAIEKVFIYDRTA